jgi:hypothetical protein
VLEQWFGIILVSITNPHTPALDSWGTALFKTQEGVTEADVQQFLEAANNLQEKIPCLASIKTGKATGMALTHGQGFEWAAVATFNSPEDFKTYQQHPYQQT